LSDLWRRPCHRHTVSGSRLSRKKIGRRTLCHMPRGLPTVLASRVPPECSRRAAELLMLLPDQRSGASRRSQLAAKCSRSPATACGKNKRGLVGARVGGFKKPRSSAIAYRSPRALSICCNVSACSSSMRTLCQNDVAQPLPQGHTRSSSGDNFFRGYPSLIAACFPKWTAPVRFHGFHRSDRRPTVGTGTAILRRCSAQEIYLLHDPARRRHIPQRAHSRQNLAELVSSRFGTILQLTIAYFCSNLNRHEKQQYGPLKAVRGDRERNNERV